jgi:hypothetical protein
MKKPTIYAVVFLWHMTIDMFIMLFLGVIWYSSGSYRASGHYGLAVLIDMMLIVSFIMPIGLEILCIRFSWKHGLKNLRDWFIYMIIICVDFVISYFLLPPVADMPGRIITLFGG